MIKRKPEDYTSNFMTREHKPITTFDQAIRRYSYNDAFLFYKGDLIGDGSFELESKKRKWLSTNTVTLNKKYRRKGHGIHLYHHLIMTAMRLGCTRLYSSNILNKFSRNMWENKLSKIYKVVPVYTKAPCSGCGSKHKRILKFYIDLDEK